MTYMYTDEDGDSIEIQDGTQVLLIVRPKGDDAAAANIAPADAPRVALEILKAASPGPTELSDMADAKSALRRVVKHYEANALDKRRAEVCKELGAAFVPAAADTALKRAIDRIIELEQQATK